MSVEDIAQAAENARARGASHIGIVNSGRGPTPEDLEIVLEAAKKIDRRQGGAIGVCASLGELPPRQAEKLAESPLVRYHHNLETSRRFFPKMVGSHDYDSKLSTLKAAKQAGLSLCSGGLFGLGETWEDRIDLAVTLRDEVQPDVVPLNFLCPIPSTPLEHVQPLTPLEILTIIAVFRLALPWVDLKIAGGRANLRTLQSWAFYAGATSCMIGNYLTTIGRSPEEDLQMFRDLDLEVVSELPDKSR
jgi:biotin synthase